jgi:hypothetical protein
VDATCLFKRIPKPFPFPPVAVLFSLRSVSSHLCLRPSVLTYLLLLSYLCFVFVFIYDSPYQVNAFPPFFSWYALSCFHVIVFLFLVQFILSQLLMWNGLYSVLGGFSCNIFHMCLFLPFANPDEQFDPFSSRLLNGT